MRCKYQRMDLCVLAALSQAKSNASTGYPSRCRPEEDCFSLETSHGND